MCSTLYEQKIPVGVHILRAYTGIGDAETQTLGILRKPWDLPFECAQGQKSFKGLPRAAHYMDRAQTSGIVAPTVELCPSHPTKRKKRQLYGVHMIHAQRTAVILSSSSAAAGGQKRHWDSRAE